MNEKEIIKKLAEMYVEKATRLSLLDEIFEEIFGIENLYVDNGWLKSEGKKIG